MPNWVKNKVRAVNKNDAKKLIEMLVTKRKDGLECTNFNGIIPMPDELRKTTAGFGDPEWDEEQKRNKKKYGYESWYDFACDRWGTKWDDLDVIISDNNTIEFESAWCMPYGIYREIAKSIPIIVAYADEDIGNNFGIVQFDCDGESSINISGTNTQIANAIWGYEYDDAFDDADKDDYDYEVMKEIDNIFDI